MFNIFKQPQKTEREIIAEIHHAFDSAENRLLQEANDILKKTTIKDISIEEKRAERLKKVGFTNTPTSKNADALKQERIKAQEKIVTTQAQADLITYYKRTYPFLKFLTEEELDKICEKYNLIYAPVGHYKEEVPEKNLVEIEAAKPLHSSDSAKNTLLFEIERFFMDVPSEIRKALKGKFQYEGATYLDGKPSQKGMLDFARKKGYEGDFSDYIYRELKVEEINKQGLFICAPGSHFDLKNLSLKDKFGYMKVTKVEYKDPIVFRYCKGGIQVITKWGLEASDPMLVNEINN